MRTIEMTEILDLYKKCHVNNNESSQPIRNTVNIGTLNNKLNLGSAFKFNGESQYFFSTNTSLQESDN